MIQPKPDTAATRVLIETIDGRTFIAPTMERAANLMRNDAWGGAGLEMPAYMKEVATRAFQWCKQPVRTDTIEAFLTDMQAIGLLCVQKV